MKLRKTSGAVIAAGIVIAGIAVGCGGGDGIESADVVLRGGKVVTMDGKRTVAQAVAVRAGRIAFVGSDADAGKRIGANTKVIELGGRMLMPGFVDAHLHSLAGGRALLLCDLNYARLTARSWPKLQAGIDATPEAVRHLTRSRHWAPSHLRARRRPDRALLDGLRRREIAVTSPIFPPCSRTACLQSRISAATPAGGGTFLRDGSGTPALCEDAPGSS